MLTVAKFQNVWVTAVVLSFVSSPTPSQVNERWICLVFTKKRENHLLLPKKLATGDQTQICHSVNLSSIRRLRLEDNETNCWAKRPCEWEVSLTLKEAPFIFM